MTDAAVRPALLVEAENWCTCADNVDEERTAHGSTGSFSRCLYCRLASALEAALEREGRLREARGMIARNSCCEPCREAGLVARAALGDAP